MTETVKVTLIKSLNGRSHNHKCCVRGLGLTGKMHQSRLVKMTPENMGMVKKVAYLLDIQECKE